MTHARVKEMPQVLKTMVFALGAVTYVVGIWLVEGVHVFDHFDGGDGKLSAFVHLACSLDGLLFGKDGEDAVDHRNLAFDIELYEALGCAGTDVVEVGRVAFDDTSEGNNGIDVSILGHSGATVDEFEASWHPAYADALFAYSSSLESLDGPF